MQLYQPKHLSLEQKLPPRKILYIATITCEKIVANPEIAKELGETHVKK